MGSKPFSHLIHCFTSRGALLGTLLIAGQLLAPALVSTHVNAAVDLPNFADLVEANASAIVEISARRTVTPRPQLSDENLEELLRGLRPDEIPDIQRQDRAPRQRGAVGSGFLISADGFVITNNHVVEGADQIQVTLNDRRVFDAEVVGLDEPSDIALLKLDAADLPFVEFGDSEAVRVGDWVLAIGSPFGLEFSAAAGIVSAKGRSVPGNSAYNYMAFIQTDVAINQGNSGGPLFNLEGDVVGINSQILSSTGGSNGISFSIPSNVAMNVVAQLKESGAVERGLLGVRMREVDYALAEIFDMDRPRGAFVDGVIDESPAGNAGVQDEDIIVEFNGHEIEYYTDLPFYVGQYQPGTEAAVRLIRDGEERRLTVVLGSSPTNEASIVVEDTAPERANPLGFKISELSEETRQVAGIDGVRIAQVEEGPGREAGLREGDVVVSLNRQPVPSVSDFASVAESLPASGFVQIRIVRQGQGTTLSLELKP
ncbi:Do family serine endopeptidase [Gammaproteobacteria bacterium]|jgi:serine protease Do|nr:Do family serine endopeptidase [Gammaproteobacteria bacterium]MCH9794340.1 Do family serine endopeptidase [Gammaproteobacteria bacterium]MDA7782739.1 Do family serine endopeptidase [Gammaproteobacteria bacterium]MDA8927633.1 Do family serine endopeptidase [Gammaproteobacteria bacterium]MDB2505250.1 Do family serine endopeptidase [Gammaproteobacteria bacterium]